VYSNLEAEMTRSKVTKTDISETIGKSYGQTLQKFNGKYPFTFDEVIAIQKTHFPELTINYLFATE